MTAPMVQVLATGPLATVQDLGRPGYAHLGVPPSGACDQPALRLANRLVGNRDTAAGAEVTIGGLAARFSHGTWLALTGARSAATVDGRPVGFHAPAFVAPGALLRLGFSVDGARTYLAVRGGLDTAPVLGSRSTDLLTAIGPPPLSAGDMLPIGTDTEGPVSAVDIAPVAGREPTPTLRFTPGPRLDWLPPDALTALTATTWTVSPDSNRVGVRLSGPRLPRVSERELASEGLVTGAIQVPHAGTPILFLNDHPVTGGYPVVGVLRQDALPLSAQLRPGQQVRLTISR